MPERKVMFRENPNIEFFTENQGFRSSTIYVLYNKKTQAFLTKILCCPPPVLL